MRLPWGSLEDVTHLFLSDLDFMVVGCLSVEERCCFVPSKLSVLKNCRTTQLLKIDDPPDAFPNFSDEIKQNIRRNKRRLGRSKTLYEMKSASLLSDEDSLLDILDEWENYTEISTVVLDITSFPKRFFCFFLKRLIRANNISNIIVSYTQASPNGYTDDYLAQDSMSCDHLPGYAAPLSSQDSTIIISIGFEHLGLRPLLEMYKDKKKETKIILPFPPNGRAIKRTWSTLRKITVYDEDQKITRDNLEVVAVWDTEQVYQIIESWGQSVEDLILAPFGPKPHSLGMTLYAIENDLGMYYTQPKSYDPNYSQGCGESWAYVVKWEGIPCYSRQVQRP